MGRVVVTGNSMPTFSYQAVRPGARRHLEGSIEAATSEQAVQALKTQGLYPIALGLAGASSAGERWRRLLPFLASSPGGAIFNPSSGAARANTGRWGRLLNSRRIKPRAVALFTRQLATLVAAGMPLLRSLETLARQERTPSTRIVLTRLADVIRSGESLSSGLSEHPAAFDRLYTNMVKAGEAGGMLDDVLERLARFWETAERIKGKVKAAMAYPVIIVTVATAIVGALTAFVVPKFEQIFLTQLKGRSLPLLTQIVIGFSKFVSANLGLVFALLVVVAVGTSWTRRQPWGKRWIDRTTLRIPVLGGFAIRVAVARFARTFGTLLGAGVPILQAVKLTQQSTANEAVADALTDLHGRLEAGESVASSLLRTSVFPALLPAMVEVGEATGKLPEMLGRIADLYDDEVDNAVVGFTSIVEPVMIVVMAVVVGTIVIALFLPMVEIIKGLSGG